MRVILDVRRAAADRITGSLTCEGSAAPLPFEGWLELMRLLESITAARSTPSPPAPLRSRGGEWTDDD